MEHFIAIWVMAKSPDKIEETKKEVEKIMLRFLKEDEFSVLDTNLSVSGGVIGILFGGGGSLLLSQFLPSSVTLWSVLVSFIVSAFVGIIFGLAPAIRASKLTPVDALRYE